MSKRNGKGPTAKELLNNYQDETLSSGVTVRILPFPTRLWFKISERAERECPTPIPPKKTVQTLGGTEEVDNLTDPDYVARKGEADRAHKNLMAQLIGDATLDLCIQVDLAPWESVLKRLEKYDDQPIPADPDERRIYFLTNFALRGRSDYERVLSVAAGLMAVGDTEVAGRLDSFRSDLARDSLDGVEAPGAPEIVGLAVE